VAETARAEALPWCAGARACRSRRRGRACGHVPGPDPLFRWISRIADTAADRPGGSSRVAAPPFARAVGRYLHARRRLRSAT